MAKSKNRRKKNYKTTKNTKMKNESIIVGNTQIKFKVDNSIPQRTNKEEKKIIKYSAMQTAIWVYMGNASEDEQAAQGYTRIAAELHNRLYVNPKSTSLDFEAVYHRVNLLERGISGKGMKSKSITDFHTGEQSHNWLLNNMSKVSPAFEEVEPILLSLENAFLLLESVGWDTHKADNIMNTINNDSEKDRWAFSKN